MCSRRVLVVTIHVVLDLICGPLLQLATADFTTVPSSLTVGVREEAVFQCQYPGASINWRVNGQPVNISHTITVTSSGEQALDTLSITALPEYNGTEVVCVALLSNFSARPTPPVHLLIDLGMFTTRHPLHDGFTISPNDNTVPEGLPAVFKCQHNCSSVIWRVNGDLVRGNATHIPSTLVNGSNIVYTLNITAEPQFNNSVVECEAIDLDQRKTAQLRVQGLLFLKRIRNTYINNASHNILVWEQPFSLDITNAEPDVVYIVEIYRLNTTCFHRSLMYSETVFVTMYEFTPLPFPYEVIVTPRNNVEGARNGTSSIFSVMNYIRLEIATTVVEVIDTDQVIVELHLSTEISGAEGIVPTSFSIELEAINRLDIDNVQTVNCQCLLDEAKNVLRPTCSVPSHRLWLYQVYDSNCSDSRVVSNEILSTHFVQNITVVTQSATSNQLIVSGDLISSKIKGFFVIAYTVSGADDVHYSIARRRSDNNGSAGTNLTLSGGVTYNISVFNINENGLPFSSSASVAQTTTVDVLTDGQMNNEVALSSEHSLHSAFIEANDSCSGLLVTCTFADDTPSGCVAVVHKRVSHFNSNYGLLNIDVRLFPKSNSGSTASGCLVNTSGNVYHVAVFSYVNGTIIGDQIFINTKVLRGEKDFKLFVSTGIVAVVVVSGLVVTATVFGMLIARRRATDIQSSHDSIELKRCGAYEMRTLSQQKVVMKKNQAYETVHAQTEI